MTFTTQRKVRFQHCDPAGIVFYPRYFEMLDSVVEDYFAEAVGHDFHGLHLDSRTGVPTAHIETDFHAPSRLGETLTFELTLRNVGRSSLALRTVARCGEQARLTCDATLVFIDLDSGRPLPWPETLQRYFAKDLQQGDRDE